MNVRTIPQGNPPPTEPRFDTKFIEEHQLIERYLQNKLPMKGARDLENWCRAHPQYLEALKLSDRAQSSLRLLEAAGQPLDLHEPQAPWWKAPWVSLGLGLLAILCVLAFWALFGKYVLLRGELADTRLRLHQGSLVQPATVSSLRLAPDRAPGVGRAKLTVSGSAPQLLDLHIDMGYLQAMQFRVIVDKQDQGRALILDNVLKDSNGELRMTVNTTGLSAGTYNVRIDALPTRGNASATAEGWLVLEVR